MARGADAYLRDIAGMRDRLAHRYWDVNHEIVWLVIEKELPKLKGGVEGLLAGKREAKRADRG